MNHRVKPKGGCSFRDLVLAKPQVYLCQPLHWPSESEC